MNSSLLIGRLGVAQTVRPGTAGSALGTAGSALGTAGSALGGVPGTAVPNLFGQVLQKALDRSASPEIRISAHAEKRLVERQIALDGELRSTLSQAIDELGRKGARDSLVITGKGAFVVNIPSRTLVTAMNVQEMEDRIVTQIDSVSFKGN